jgi:hypothetical protein
MTNVFYDYNKALHEQEKGFEFHIYIIMFSSLVTLPEIFRYHYVTKPLQRPIDILPVSPLYNSPFSHWRQQYCQASSKAASSIQQHHQATATTENGGSWTRAGCSLVTTIEILDR